MRFVPPLLVLLLTAVAPAGDFALAPEKRNPRARRMREEALEAWAPLAEFLKTARSEAPSPETVRETLPKIAAVVKDLEKALALEWDADANRTEHDAVHAWVDLYRTLPEAKPPEDAAEREAWENSKERRERVRDARRFVMEVARRRAHTKVLGRCPRCEGRKEIRSPFGDKHACEACRRSGLLVDRDGAIDALWMVYSPGYRNESRNERRLISDIANAPSRPAVLGPFVRSLSIESTEDHDVWVRFVTEERRYAEPDDKKYEKVRVVYDVFRAGDTWFLYSPREDGTTLAIPKPEDPSGEPQ